ncbi:MAG: diacylglycerol/lipid kinase family protein, partial [Myxococcota bacterium]
GEVRGYLTEKPLHATALARRAIEEGAEVVISVGGDGTNNEVLNGLFDNGKPLNPDAAMAVFPGGTGGDFARLLKVPKDPVEAAKRFATSAPRRIDVGRLTCIDHAGQEAAHMFLNIAGFGIGGEVDARVNRTTKMFGGFASFLWATLVTLFTYRNRPVHLRVDDVLDEECVIQHVTVANGQYFGGGMWAAPEAALDDGLFDIIISGDITKREMILHGGDIYKGEHLAHPKNRFLRGRRVTASAAEATLIDMDGEQPGRLPVTLEIVPAAVRFLGA